MSCNPANEQDSRDDGQHPPPSSSSNTALSSVDGDATSLYQYIIRQKVWGTNLDPPESAKNAIKPWDQRLSTADCVQSNVDDQLTITVPFTCLVRIKSILIHTGTGDFAPTRCRAFVNRPDGIDFDEADAATADTHPAGQPATRIASTLGAVGSGRAQADFALLQGQEGVVEYPVSVARFSSTNSVTLVLSHSASTTLSRFFYLGFRGTALQLSKDPSERLDIAAANAADKPVDGVREKRTASHGLAGGSSSRTNSPRFTVSDKAAARRVADIAQGSPQRQRAAKTAPNTAPRKGRSSRGGGAADDAATTTPGGPSASSAVGADDRNRRRSLSQPPPADMLFRQLHQQQQQQQQRAQQPSFANTTTMATTTTTTTTVTTAGAGPSQLRTPGRSAALGKTPLRSVTRPGVSATPAKRPLGTPHRPGEHSIGSLAQTPATEKRKKRNDALMQSAQRTREKRPQSIWGLGGWAGGREESPFDLLRRLARAPGFVAPPTPQQVADAANMPPPAPGSAAAAAVATANRASLSAAQPSSSSARNSLTTGGRGSTSGRQSSMLRPGESVPGDLTRDSEQLDDSADMDESGDVTMPSAGDDASSASASTASGRKSLMRKGIFAALAERGRNVSGRVSDAASRLSLGGVGDISALSAATSALTGGQRETELEKSLAMSLGELDASSLASTSRDDLSGAEALAMERLDELTRRSLFSDHGGLSLGDAGADVDDRSRSTRARSFMRSMSEPLQPDADDDYSTSLAADFGPGAGDEDDDGPLEDEESEVEAVLDDRSLGSNAVDASRSRSRVTFEDADDSRVTIGGSTTDAAGLSSEVSRAGMDADESDSRLQDRSALSDSRSRTNILTDAGDVSVISAPLEALSDEDDPGFETASTDPGDDDDDDEDAAASDDGGDVGIRKLDLMDPKDLNALLKRRIVRKRKARVSPYTGAAVPQLPASTIKEVFTSFLNPSAGSQTSASLLGSTSGNGRRSKAKLDRATLEEVEEAAHDFFASFAQQLHSQAKARTKRRGTAAAAAGKKGVTMTEVDVLALLKQQGHVTARSDITSLAHRLLPREVLDQMNLAKFSAVRTDTATPSLRSMLGLAPGAAAGGSSRAPAGAGTKKRTAVAAAAAAASSEEEDEEEGGGTDDDESDDDDDNETADTSRSRNARGPAAAPARKKARPSTSSSSSSAVRGGGPRTPARRTAPAALARR